ncbi:GNAT family N-acetyltransferase [Octadecabacter sp. G9-8]|uniref:L-ornithine N(alpha)-acyltransferase n=1 Tax=Octadecabacter dasysiphoniae TaxID=2909341 RepID=A0ABS9CYF5_9RHOB|nr:GNAT family N-acyltransferase [Octadecabacter dasysiphoniae]MCF2872301.1 GNAT family N-acetyltransferase [Octadecabacter dasysiphoniae]
MAKDNQPNLPDALHRGGYVARFAQGAEDLAAAAALRHLCFVESAGRPALADGLDTDQFDGRCDHVLVEDSSGRVLCCFRVLALASGAELNMSYSAQYYDLERLLSYRDPMIELGRFCVHPDVKDGDVLRIAWGMLAAYVDAQAAGLLFGCASFEGTQAAHYGDAFDLLAARHLAPDAWMPDVRAPDVVAFGRAAKPVRDHAAALGQLPSLLRTYLSMGGWVSDHAVIDRDMNTLHVFTGLEISAIPAARAKALRSV